jgi:hypothetical protein
MQTCQVDPNGVHTVANAWAAGLAHVDVSFQHKPRTEICWDFAQFPQSLLFD